MAEVNDIAPALLEKVQGAFYGRLEKSKKLKRLAKKIGAGKADYLDANEYAIEVGEQLAAAFKQHLSSKELPDGRMYYNIADRVVRIPMEEDYRIVSEMADEVQRILNEQANIGIAPQTPELNKDRIDGIINRLSHEEDFDAVKWLLDENIVNFSQSIVDDAIHANADFQFRSGMTPKIIRRSDGKCCAWCSKLVGTYDYEAVKDTGNDVFRRHKHCRCTVDFIPINGKRQNVHTKVVYEGAAERKALASVIDAEQSYKPVKRNSKVIQDSKYQDVILRGIDGYDDVYVSDGVSIKPRALHNMHVDREEAIKSFGGNPESRPRLAVLSSHEIGEGTVALYDAVSNTIYTIPEVGDRKKIVKLQAGSACPDNPKATMYHEMWHWMQAEEYEKAVGEITKTNKGDYIKFAVRQGKRRLDRVEINEYNISRLSEYAKTTYKRGRYDECDAELAVYKYLRSEKDGYGHT